MVHTQQENLKLWMDMAADKKPKTIWKFFNTPGENDIQELDDVAYLLLSKIAFECVTHNRTTLACFASGFKPYSYSKSSLKSDYNDLKRCEIVRTSRRLAAMVPVRIKMLLTQELINIYSRQRDTMIGANYEGRYILEITEKGIIQYLKKVEAIPFLPWNPEINPQAFCMGKHFISLKFLVAHSSYVRNYYKNLGIHWCFEKELGWHISNDSTQAAIQRGLFEYLLKKPPHTVVESVLQIN